MFIDDNGVGHCYDFDQENPSTPTPCIPYPAMKKTAFPLSAIATVTILVSVNRLFKLNR